MWFGSVEKVIKMGPDTISPSAVIRDLEVFFDSELNMKLHISQITRACFYHLRRLWAVRSQLGGEVSAHLVYCYFLLAELPASALTPLQRVMIVAAWLVCDLSSRDHVTSARQSLHWLSIKQWIEVTLCLLVHLTKRQSTHLPERDHYLNCTNSRSICQSLCSQ